MRPKAAALVIDSGLKNNSHQGSVQAHPGRLPFGQSAYNIDNPLP